MGITRGQTYHEKLSSDFLPIMPNGALINLITTPMRHDAYQNVTVE